MADNWNDAAVLAERGFRREQTANGVSCVVAGEGPALVMLHGGSGAWNHWIETLGPLSERFRAVAPDLPGFGLSDAPDPEIPNEDYLALCAEAVLEIAGERPLHLAGFSFGGYLAAALADRLAPRVRALTLIGPNGFPKPVDRGVALYGLRTLEKRLGRAATEPEIREMHRNNLSELMLSKPAAAEDWRVDMHSWNVARTRFDSRRLSWCGEMAATFARLTLPTQVIYGALDRSQNPTIEGRMLELKALRPEIALVNLENVGHWAMDEGAAEVNKRLAAFHGG